VDHHGRLLGRGVRHALLVAPMKNLIRDMRGERGWSQAHLADLLSVSRQTVIAIETGRYDPSLPLAFTISRLFEQPIEAIFFPNQEPA
jgi:putative transcriptional regulator